MHSWSKMRYSSTIGIHHRLHYMYYRIDDCLQRHSFCIMSDDMDHDVSLGYQIQNECIEHAKRNVQSLKKIRYFSDACEAQYKTKNFFEFMLSCHGFQFGSRMGVFCHKSWQITMRWHWGKHHQILTSA